MTKYYDIKHVVTQGIQEVEGELMPLIAADYISVRSKGCILSSGYLNRDLFETKQDALRAGLIKLQNKQVSLIRTFHKLSDKIDELEADLQKMGNIEKKDNVLK